MPRDLVLRQSNHDKVTTSLPSQLEDRTLPEFLLSIKAFSRKHFRRWAYFVSTHQIFVLLLSSALIFSLSYPVIFLYVWTTEGHSRLVDAQNLWRFVSKPVRDRASFGAAVGDLRMPWELAELRGELLSTDDEMCWENVGVERVVRMEQVLVTTEEVLDSGGGISGPGVVDRRTLEAALDLQEKIQTMLKEEGIEASSCILSRDGQSCLVLSPWDFFSLSSTTTTTADTSAPTSASTAKADSLLRSALLSPLHHPHLNTTLSGLPLSLETTFAGRVMSRDRLIRANYLALTFFLESSPPVHFSRSAHSAWTRSLASVAGDWARLLPAQRWAARRLFVLKYRPRLPLTDRHLEDAFYALGYLVVGAHVWRKSGKVKGLHSLSGIRIAAATSLAATGVMTFSVCALAGLSLGLAPGKMLPLLVIVSGADNLLILSRSVTRTGVFLPVKERIARGLERVGAGMVAFLGFELHFIFVVLRYVKIKTIKEWVGFIAVTLITSYAMEMTFFLAVLSIDLGRLELGDLLSGPELKKDLGEEDEKERADQKCSLFKCVLRGLGRMLKERGAKTFTFGSLVVINTSLILFYGRDHYLPAFCSQANPDAPNRLLSPSLGNDLNNLLAKEYALSQPSGSSSPAEVFWNVVNPNGASSIHVYVEPASVLALRSPANLDTETTLSAISVWFEPFSLFARFVVLPLVLSLFTMYLFLLYLLKDSDKLALERERAKMALEKEAASAATQEELLRIDTWKGRHGGDVDLASSNRETIVSWSAFEEFITVWKGGSDRILLPVSEDESPLTSLAVDENSTLCAAVTRGGNVVVWTMSRKRLRVTEEAEILVEPLGKAIKVLFVSGAEVSSSPSSPTDFSKGGMNEGEGGRFLSFHEGGAVVSWDYRSGRGESSIAVPPPEWASSQPVKLHLLDLHAPYPSKTYRPLIAQVSQSGLLSLWKCEECSTSSSPWKEVALFSPSTTVDPIVTLGAAEFCGQLVLVVGCASGSTTLWDVEFDGGKKMAEIASFSQIGGTPKQIRVLGECKARCSRCSSLTVDSLIIMIGSTGRLLVQRAILSSSCGCSSNSPRRSQRASMVSPDTLHHPRQRSSMTSLRDAMSATPRKNGFLTPPVENSELPPPLSFDLSDLMVETIAELEVDERGVWELLGVEVVGVGRTNVGGRSPWEFWILPSLDDLPASMDNHNAFVPIFEPVEQLFRSSTVNIRSSTFCILHKSSAAWLQHDNCTIRFQYFWRGSSSLYPHKGILEKLRRMFYLGWARECSHKGETAECGKERKYETFEVEVEE
ncbi:hypothetical protein BT69DRAFT_1323755 [Atractiella rhizophila]|nr:hypothetical protein BT69DRAFT_1323755 [Atractiella rhizophila]